MRKFLKPLSAAVTAVGLLWAVPHAAAFCGFYVAKADANLFNKASKVVIARDGDSTVVTMANDYQGDPKEFAMVIPTPVVLARNQIRVSSNERVDTIDGYSAPRLVEYFDPDPCPPPGPEYEVSPLVFSPPPPEPAAFVAAPAPAVDFGVTIEAQYEVEEYDILILSAEESDGLQRWLTKEGYKVPPKANDVLASYIAQDMKFFVAKVNLDRLGAAQDPDWNGFLRPLQIAYEHGKFMLPIRLGTVNANGPQDLLVYFLTRNGRVEATNYRTLDIPSEDEIPPFVEERFDDFYRALFDKQVAETQMKAVFTEYSWPLQIKCDPCVAGAPTQQELIELGATWLAEDYKVSPEGVVSFREPDGWRVGPAHLTRLHMRYTAETFPQDLMFQETGDKETFQGRYVMRQPFRGNTSWPAGQDYLNALNARHKTEAANLANLTGWNSDEIKNDMREAGFIAPRVVNGELSFDSLGDWVAWLSRDDSKDQ